jgi:fermentation-respiration switch protein FrsA (DUF1100 family)
MPSQRIRRFIKLASFTVLVTLVAGLGVLPIGISYLATRALTHHPCGNSPSDLTEAIPSAESIQLSPADQPQVVLEGWYAPGTNGAGIIALGGAFGGRNTLRQEVEWFHAAGYSILVYDTRSCANPPQVTSLGYSEIADLRAGVDFLLQQPQVEDGRIGVFGFSAGAATAIMGAARDERLRAVVAVGNYAHLSDNIGIFERTQAIGMERWLRFWMEWFFERNTQVDPDTVNPIDDLPKISPRPVLLIHGSLELPYTRGQEQYNAAKAPKDWWLIPGTDHGDYIQTVGALYGERIIAFFDRYLLYDS